MDNLLPSFLETSTATVARSGGTRAGTALRGGRLRHSLTKPMAAPLSAYPDLLRDIERSCWLSNYGPVNGALERALTDKLFGGRGATLTVSSATVGLMLALRAATWRRPTEARYVVMPAFTFAAAAHAVLWAGLTPLLIDSDPDDWSASASAERRALERCKGTVAAVMPYATFGRHIDLARYDAIADEFGLPIVVDAAASVGTTGADGLNFGAATRHTVVFSMHATKAFGVGEGGFVHSGNSRVIEELRCMGQFGFNGERAASMPGLNAKLSEIAALSASIKLQGLDACISHRQALAERYGAELPGWQVQAGSEPRRAFQFMPMLLPPDLAAHRDAIQGALSSLGVGTGCYFSPHIAQQPYFERVCAADDLPVADDLSRRVISLPIHDGLQLEDVGEICALARAVCDDVVGR